MTVKWILLAILVLPVAEIVAYLAVAAQIGFLRAFALQIVCSLVGVVVLRQAARTRLARLRTGMRAGADRGYGAAAVQGGILLLIPGFITDLLGIIMLVEPLRRGLGALIRRATAADRREQTSPAVIDLPSTEWHEVAARRRPPKRTPKRHT